MTSEILTPNKNYNRIRHFLRLLFLHGCYSRNSFTQYKILSEKQYRNYTNLIMEYLDEKHHNIQQYSRESLKLDFEYYDTKSNYLVDSYLSKSSSSNYISVYFLTLQLLHQKGRPLKRSEIMDELFSIYGFDRNSLEESTKEISEASIYNYLKEFVKLDILKETENKEFCLSKDIFENLCIEELRALYNAVSFFTNTVFPSTPGYYLKNSLNKYITYKRNYQLEDKEVFLHRFTPFHSVLDDGVVIESLKAINSNKKVKICYEKFLFDKGHYSKEKHFLDLNPIKVIFDLSLGRWYLACLDDDKVFSLLRMDRIQGITIMKSQFNYKALACIFEKDYKNIWTASTPFDTDEIRTVTLQIPRDGKHTVERLIKEGQDGQLILGDDDNYYYTLQVKDDEELLPWLRTLSPYIKIVGSENLKNKFINDLMEMRTSYGII